jgi:aryl-alcohol dehydrogenase-like predicted oxidoreductase
MFDAVTCTIPGAKNKNQVAENAHASALPPLPTQIMKSVKSLYERFIKEKVHQYW